MDYCTQCNSIEQGFKHVLTDNEEFLECESCGAADSKRNYDEDYGLER
jgi:translation initiation factor 2 beta subunit (eIF-2beta)/eIF-5